MNNDYNGFINEIYAGGIREFFAGGSSADFPALLCVAGGLLILAVMLLTALYVLRNHTVRIYNWNGKRSGWRICPTLPYTRSVRQKGLSAKTVTEI